MSSIDNNGNPIVAVGTTSTPTTTVICPSTFSYDEEDVSSEDAGRTQDGKMHKNRISTKVKLNMSWSYLEPTELSTLLSLFNNEYLYIKFICPNGNTQVTKKFYMGNRTSPLYNGILGIYTSFSVNAIEV